ncbi:MAG TPA: hypothetical protein VEV38_07440 [Candidatus Eremiobacteraceae bacterium]|nr:hypothetical protein [Candidatus Eremiobacteraceae bacterium]
MTTAGVITHVGIPFNGSVYAITAGPDGGAWFTSMGDPSTAIFGRIDTSTLSVVTYNVSSDYPLFGNLVAGSDGNLWSSRQSDGDLLRITPTGEITAYAHGLRRKIVNDSAWLANRNGVLYGVYGSANYLVRFSEKNLVPIAHIKIENRSSEELWTRDAFGPDSNLWISDLSGSKLTAYLLRILSVNPTSIVLSVGSQQTIDSSESKEDPSRLQATSSNPGIASVAKGLSAGTFIVSGMSSGSCTVTVSDPHGNLVEVSVTIN